MIAGLFRASLRAEPGRHLLTVLVIALGVALITAIHTLNHSAMAELEQASRKLSGTADLRIEAGRSGFADDVFGAMVMHADIAAASPIVDHDLTVAGHSRPLRVMGIDIFRALWIQPALMPKPRDANDRLAALRPQNIFLNQAALDHYRLQAGARIQVASPSGPLTLTVAGTLAEDAAGLPLAVMDIAAVQSHFGLTGRLSRIDLRLREGVAPGDVQAALSKHLPAGAVVAPPAQTMERTALLSRGYRANLTVLALVALFTGGFLVFSIAALSVVKRRAELALLRVLGVTRRQLLTGLVMESVVASAVGSGLGILAGLFLADVVMRIFAGQAGGFFAHVAMATGADAPMLILIMLAGTLAGAAGCLVPALEAADRPPARALKAGDDAALMQRTPPARIGLLLMAIAVPLLLLPPVQGVPVGGYAAIALLLFGTLLVLPALLMLLARRLRAPRALLPQLAWQQLVAMPGYAVSGLATVIVSISLVTAMAIMVHSFRHSLQQWLGGVMTADVYVRSPGGINATLPPAIIDGARKLPGLKSLEPARYQSVLLHPDQPGLTLIARQLDDATINSLSIQKRARTAAPPNMPVAWLSEAGATLHAKQPGDVISLPLGGKWTDFYIAGLWRDYSRTWGAAIIDISEYSQRSGDSAINDIALTFDTAAQAGASVTALRALPDGSQLEIALSSDIRRLSLSIFDRTFAVTYALELAALIIGLAGIAAHFAALTHQRRKTFGMLRHLGFSRQRIGRLLALEGAVTGAAGAVVGLALGAIISLVLIHVVNRQSFHWGMEWHLPWLPLAVLAVALVLLAAAAARLAGKAAMGMAAVQAVRADA